MTSNNPSSRSPPGHGSHSPYPTPISSAPPQAPNFFDTSLFHLNGASAPSLSQAYQPPVPAIPTLKRPCSPTLKRPSPSPQTTPFHTTPYDSSVSYDSSPAIEMYDEFTTPDFDEVEMPPLATDDNIYDYPPSPRATKSPSPNPTKAHLDIDRGADNGHPTPLSLRGSASTPGGDDTAAVVKRSEDGVWVGSAGLDPGMRGDEELMFNLKEMTLRQAVDAKNAEIEDWLKRNTDPMKKGRGRAASSAGGGGAPGGLTVKAPKRGRAKSFSDFHAKDVAAEVRTVVVVDDDDSSEEDDSSVASSFNEGSLDEVLADDESMSTSEAPPTEEELRKTEQEEEEEQRRLANDPAYFPRPRQFYSAHPWNDTVRAVARGARITMKNQPHTANAAIHKFQAYAENIETASRVATFGSQASRSRRLSAGDADKTLVDSGLLKRLSFGRDKDKDKESAHQRRPSLWGNMVKNSLKRGFSNAGAGDHNRKEKDGENDPENADSDTPARRRGDSTASSIASSIASNTPFAPPKTRKSWTKGSLGLKVDIPVTSVNSALAQMAGISAGVGKSSAHSKPTSPAPPEKRPTGLGMLRRPRSKSELGAGSKLSKSKQPTFGIVGLLGQYGGPPALPIKSPVGSASSAGDKLKPSFTFGEESRLRGIADVKQQLLSLPETQRHDGYDDDDDEMEEGGDEAPAVPAAGAQPQTTRLPKLNITPNPEGFAAHVRERTPKLHPKLVERIVYEQGKRYKKLVDHRQKHLAAIKNGGRCSNGTHCRGSVGAIGAGGQEDGSGHKRNASSGSYEEAYSSDETVGDHSPTEGKVAATQFPPGVPQPPVLRLPAEFECPICFKVKKFTKPSDWTKHVHEDVHPFTCTFPDCTEPKSFKRKADWVRHENERHRHLEWWTCNIPDCNHTCYRKDNFVQHLVREHKMAEPKLKAQKAAARAAGKTAGGKKGKKPAAGGAVVDGAPTQEDFDRVWQIVDDCHRLTDKLPGQEKCRFCGNSCPTWKKLTVHLARHMETISLPVLDLIADDSVVPPSTKSSAGKASRAAAMPRVQPAPPPQLVTDMDIDSVGGFTAHQRQSSADGEYEDDVFPAYTAPTTYPHSHHQQQTPPRSSTHLPLDHYTMHTPPYPTSTSSSVIMPSPNNLNYPGLHPAFEYPSRHELYPSPAAPTSASGYSPSPTYSHPGQRHLQVQPSYFSYGQASGQVQGVGVGQAVAPVGQQGLAHGLIENNNGQYPLYEGGTEIPMAMMEVVEMPPMDPENPYWG